MTKDTCATCAFAHSFSYIIDGGEGLGDCDYHCGPCHEDQVACHNYKDESEDTEMADMEAQYQASMDWSSDDDIPF